MKDFYINKIKIFLTARLQALLGEGFDVNSILVPYLENLKTFFQEQLEKVDRLNEGADFSFEVTQNTLQELEEMSWENLKSEVIDSEQGVYPICCRFEMFSRATISNMDRLFRRVSQDAPLINRLFLNQADDAPLNLVQIIPTGGEYHNYANQVLFLDFLVEGEEGEQQIKRVVYKPSPMLLDAMIFGGFESFHEVSDIYPEANENYRNAVLGETDSISEMMNKNLSKNNFIPTYTILPLFDSDELSEGGAPTTEIMKHYGYSEYINRKGEIQNPKKLTEETKGQIESGHYERQIVDVRLHDSKEITDFIKQLSYQCGLQVAIILITGLTDMHNENGVAVVERDENGSLMPMLFLIDGEVGFSFKNRSIAETSCFTGAGYGLMSQDGYSNKKNQILFYDGEKLDTVPLSFKHIKKGLKEGLNILKRNGDLLEAWFKRVRDFGVPFRVLPQGTAYLNGDISIMNQDSFPKRVVEGEFNLDRLRRNFDFEVFDLLRKGRPQSVFFLRDQDCQAILDEYICFGIPACYVISGNLYFSSGSILEAFTNFEALLLDTLNALFDEDLSTEESIKEGWLQMVFKKHLDFQVELERPESLIDFSKQLASNILIDVDQFLSELDLPEGENKEVLKSAANRKYSNYNSDGYGCCPVL